MQLPLLTSQQVQEHLRTNLRQDRGFSVTETRHGWACQIDLTAEELTNGQALGLACYMVDKQTGTITVHSSLPPTVIGAMYDQAIETGSPRPGRRVYPPTWRVHLQTNWETPHEIEYRIRADSLIRPPLPSIDHTLTINKNNHRYYTNQSATHEACTQAMSWAVFNSRNGAWPQTATFEY